MTPGDEKDRLRAVQSKANLAVTAGAGTGKTTLLVSKIVRKVVHEGVPVEAILALTFTEKAANEMLARVREGLAEAGRTEGLEKAMIGTIHGFCARVLREFPVEAGVAPGFTVDEGAHFRRLFEEAWPKWLDGELGPGARRPKQWRELLEKVDLAAMRELAEGLASFAIPAERGGGPAMLREFTADLSRRAPEVADALAGRTPPKRPGAKATADAKIAAKLAGDVPRIDEALASRAIDFAEDFARGFRRDYLAAGYVSFDAMLAKVHELLESREFPNVRELLREEYRYILVDEFQDTDPLQGEIIQRLAEGPDGKLVPGRLFLVGDPKQSIYSFRGADIVSYQTLVERILREGGEPVVLRTNFRSHGRILDLVNAVFSKVIVENRKLQPKYEPIEPEAGRKPEYPEPVIEAILVTDAKAEPSREVEAAEIATWIQAHRPIPYRDIAILFRSLVDVPMYIEALRSRGIPYVVEGEKYFYGTSEVIDFVNLLRAVANPNDRVAIAGVLRSPYGGLTDQQLYDRRKALDYRADASIPIFGFLRRWHDLSGTVGVGALIDTLFAESCALEAARAGYHGEQAVANLLKLRRKAGELEAQGGCTLREFLGSATQAVRELEEEGESPLADESFDAVKILSIHRAKGLEFPVVILPDLHRQSASKAPPAVRYDWPSRTLGVRLGGVMNAGGAALAHHDRERKREEWRRLLYVAMTRAEEILVLLGSTDHGAESYLGLVLDDLRKHGLVREVECKRPPFTVPPPAAAEKEKPDWPAFVSAWRGREKRAAAVAERITSPSKLEGYDKVSRLLYHTEEGESGPPSRAVQVGVACHAVMERLDFKAPAVPEGTDPEAAEILRGFFTTDVFKALAASEIVARELPFVVRRGGQIVQGVIDVVYRRGGKTYVADYKTDKMVEPGKYGLIREIYSSAVAGILDVEPAFRLIYLRHGREVEA